MPKTITNEDGSTEEVFTKAELDAQLQEKDDHVKTKLEEFQKGKTAMELAEEARKTEIAEATRIATEALATAETSKQEKITTVKNYFAESVVGQDAELRTKLDDSLKIIEAGRLANGMDVTSEKAIQEMTVAAANMAGISASAMPDFPMTGGGAPDFNKKEGTVDEADHAAFLEATGYNNK